MYKTRFLQSHLKPLKSLTSNTFRLLKFSLRHNHYKTLGIREGAPKDQIKKAYINLTKKYHPDTVNAKFEVSDQIHIFEQKSNKSDSGTGNPLTELEIEEAKANIKREAEAQLEKSNKKFLEITAAYEALTKKGGTEIEVTDENLSRRDRQQAARYQAQADIDEKRKWKGLEDNKKAVAGVNLIWYIVYAGILFNLLILVGATEEITSFLRIGDIYKEDEVLDDCVLRATQEYNSNIKGANICTQEKNIEKILENTENPENEEINSKNKTEKSK